MAKLSVSLLLFFSFCCLFNTAKSPTNSNPQTTDFIQSECRTTRYPALCLRCLSNYSTTVQLSQGQLAQAAISVSFSRAQSAASFVSKLARKRGMKPAETAAVKDSKENFGVTVDQLSRFMKELGGMGRAGLQLARQQSADVGQHGSDECKHVSGWVSGPAMNGNVKVVVRRRVVDCAQVTSNALALVNRFAARHKERWRFIGRH